MTQNSDRQRTILTPLSVAASIRIQFHPAMSTGDRSRGVLYRQYDEVTLNVAIQRR